jgi:hypothetical protein
VPNGKVHSHQIEHPLLTLFRQPIPHPHDESKIRVFDVICGQGVGKGSLMRRFLLILTELRMK